MFSRRSPRCHGAGEPRPSPLSAQEYGLPFPVKDIHHAPRSRGNQGRTGPALTWPLPLEFSLPKKLFLPGMCKAASASVNAHGRDTSSRFPSRSLPEVPVGQTLVCSCRLRAAKKRP
jgi:hypothetical protein